MFTCKLGAADGRVFEKEFDAASAEILKQTLEDQGFFVFGIRKKPLQFLLEKGVGRKVDSRQILSFNQELLVLLKAGLPLVQAFDTILERIDKGTFAEVVRDVREDVKAGISLSDAISKHPRVFPYLYIASIRAGEKTGDLPLTIRRYNDYLKKAQGLKKKLTGALVYPAILVTVAFIAITILLIYVVPTFSQVYADAGSSLPLPTQMLIAFAGALKRFFPLLLVLGFLGGAFFRSWAQTESGRYRIDAVKLKVPVAGGLWLKYSLATFCRTLATVIGSGIPIVESLKMSVGTLNNVIIEKKMLEAVTRVEEGIRLSVALERSNIMPPLALRMLSVGETTGAMEEILTDISEHLEEEIESGLHVITTSIEPLVMVVMGLVVGVIIITMYLPVFRIGGTAG